MSTSMLKPTEWVPLFTSPNDFQRKTVGLAPTVALRRTKSVSLCNDRVSEIPILSMESMGISDTRSLHNDTDFVLLSATVGANPTVFLWKSLGDVNNGTHSVGLSIEVDIPDDDTIVAFNYLILNNGHGGNDAMAKAAQSALSTIAEE